jgi:hypothetical protein
MMGQWNLYAQNTDLSNHLFGTTQGVGTTILTLLGRGESILKHSSWKHETLGALQP